MGLLDRFVNLFRKTAKRMSIPFFVNRQIIHEFDDSGGSRPVPNDTFGGSRKTFDYRQEGTITKYGKYVKLEDVVFRRYSPQKLLQLLKHNHPDVSQAVWNFKIIGNSGYRIRVTKLDGVSEHASGQKLIDDFIRGLDFYSSSGYEKSRSLDRIVDQMFDSALLRGAVAMEMVMNKDYSDVLYLAPVDPDTITFKVEKGRVVPYQENVRLDIPTFFHEGLDETETDPYGTTPFLSVIQTIAFHQQVLEDLRQVIHNQGYGK